MSKAAAFLINCSLLILCGCEPPPLGPEFPPSIKVGPTTSFAVHGSGFVVKFAVYSPPHGLKVASPFNIMWMLPDPDIAPIAWQIDCPTGSYSGVAAAEGLVLHYGRVPSGCLQTVPGQSQPTPSLLPETIYSFSIETFYRVSTAFASGYFYVDKSGTVEPVEVPDFCLQRKNDHQARVDCKTNEPYKEPSDIAKFAQDHRKAQ